MNAKLTSLALAFLLVPAVLANSNDAKVRVVHASPDAPAVDILVNNTIRAFSGVAFGDTTSYATLPANVYNTKVVPAGGQPNSAVIDADLNLFYTNRYTVVATDYLANITPMVLPDRAQPSPDGFSALRFLHASPDAPAVDIKVANGPYLFQNVAFQEVGAYVMVPSGSYDIEVRVAGTNTVVMTLPGIALQNTKNYTAIAAGLASGSPALTVLLNVDSARPIINGGF